MFHFATLKPGSLTAGLSVALASCRFTGLDDAVLEGDESGPSEAPRRAEAADKFGVQIATLKTRLLP
jgi:hypothetical protein